MSGFCKAIFVVLFISHVLHCYGGEQSVTIEEEDLELERQLKIINKPAVKTFQTEYGDTVDCVDIYKQPAFDHHLLKNHKIQRRPSSALPVVKKEVASLGKPVNVSMGNRCPFGSVPIRRTTKADLIRSKLSKPSDFYNSPAYRPGSHFSFLNVRHDDFDYYGARAYIDSYNPKVENGQSSAAQIWIKGGPRGQVNSIEIGWVVDPGLYGDNRTRLFTYWTGDGYISTGCYDILCPGFVHIDKEITLGGALPKTSTVGGDQYVMLVFVYQDQKTGNWWFVLSRDNIYVGYWPKELFPHLVRGRGASAIFMGGRAQGVFNHLSPPMGSGLYPNHSFHHACFFAQVQVLNFRNHLHDPNTLTRPHNDKSGCYGLDDYGQAKNMGYAFLFGGPGGHCN